MTHFGNGDGYIFRPPTIHEFDFRIESTVGYVDTASSSTIETDDDANIETVTADYSDPYYDLTVNGDSEGVVLSALDATGSLAGNRLSRVSDGMCRVLARHPLLSKTISLNMTRISENTYSVLTGYVSGSLARHIDDQIKALIGVKTAADMPIYSVQNHSTPTYTRNTSCWMGAVDLTAISPWNSLGAQYRAGVAISPRHTLHAKHFPVQVGTVLRFVTNGNVVVTRTIDSVANLAESANYQRDVQIAKLDSDLPETITPVKFLPANAYDYLPTWKTWKIPVVYSNQFERMACALANAFTVSPVDYVGAWVTTESPYATMYERVITLDSGSPAFFVINGTLVLICHWTFAGQGAAHHQMLTEIAAAITSLGGEHSLQTADLDEFPSYA